MQNDSNLNSGLPLSQNGYSQEDKYFHDLERQRRGTTDDKNYQKIAANENRCPQCSGEHQATKILGVDATECTLCHGIFLSEEQAKAIQDLSAGQASS